MALKAPCAGVRRWTLTSKDFYDFSDLDKTGGCIGLALEAQVTAKMVGAYHLQTWLV